MSWDLLFMGFRDADAEDPLHGDQPAPLCPVAADAEAERVGSETLRSRATCALKPQPRSL